MLGLGYSELLLVVTAAAVVLGPKDVPRVARAAGLATGRAVAYVARLRAKAFEAVEASEVAQARLKLGFVTLHGDLRETARQLQQIRSELRSGVSLLPARVGAAVPSATRSDAALPSALPPAARHLRASANSPLPGELPFSASSLGRVPPRGPGATGSDIAADALEEETVSRLTSQFLAQGDRGEDRGGDGGGGKAGAGE